MNSKYIKIRNLLLTIVGAVFMVTAAPASAQVYKDVTRLGTSQAICSPGIETAEELQAFFANNPQAVRNIMNSAGWSGNADDLFAAVAAGDFTERPYAPGTTFQWMSARKGGTEVALPYRRWAGAEAFSGFEVNLVSNCQEHQIVIPKACCNVSLIGSSPVAAGQPNLTTSVTNDTLTVCSDEGANVRLVYPSGQTQALALDGNGCWSGDLPSGTYTLEAEGPGQCGTPASARATIVEKERGLIPFVGAFYGTETRPRFETAWAMDMRDSSGIAGINVGVLGPINDNLNWLVQAGYLDRSGINEGNVYPSNNWFIDVGLERKIGERGFFGGGIGIWNVDDSDFEDASVFLHGGSYIGNTSLQWYLEARAFFDELDEIDDNKVFMLGLRYLFE